jgi:hypothetical protein
MKLTGTERSGSELVERSWRWVVSTTQRPLVVEQFTERRMLGRHGVNVSRSRYLDRGCEGLGSTDGDLQPFHTAQVDSTVPLDVPDGVCVRETTKERSNRHLSFEFCE